MTHIGGKEEKSVSQFVKAHNITTLFLLRETILVISLKNLIRKNISGLNETLIIEYCRNIEKIFSYDIKLFEKVYGLDDFF